MGGAGVVGVEGGSEQETCWETFRVQTCSPLFWPFLSWLCCRKARWRTGACWRTSSRTWRGRTNIRTTSTAQVYDAAPTPVRALHQEDLRTATRQGKQIKSSMLPAYCDPPNPCPLGYTAQDGCIEDFENNSEFSQKYQASQNCMCDTEHMFACPQAKQQGGGLSFLGGFPSVEENPFLAGAKLSIAAKKGMGY